MRNNHTRDDYSGVSCCRGIDGLLGDYSTLVCLIWPYVVHRLCYPEPIPSAIATLYRKVNNTLMIDDSALAVRVQLETGVVQRRPLPSSWRGLLGGGRGLTAKLTSELPPDLAPLDPKNPLILAPGLLHNTSAIGAAGIFIGAKSPLTGLLAQSWAEGELGKALSGAGVALLILIGTAVEWSVLIVTNEGMMITPAGSLMGQDTVATAEMLQEQHGSDAHVLALGPAGEAGVAYAAPVVDGRYMVEPAGVGAVMAAKRIKAIVVRGGETRLAVDQVALAQLNGVLRQRAETLPLLSDVRRFGSAAYINILNDLGAVTARNGQDGMFGGMLALSRSTLALRGKQEYHGACPLHCYADFSRSSGTSLPRPDLEALLGFGVRCGVADLEIVLLANERCLRLGLDVAATANAIAFLMECQQHGLHSAPILPWGDGDVVLDVLEKIGRKEGVGGVLSLGVGEMQSIFWGSDAWAPQVRGGALSPIDPRPLPTIALHVATSTWPGDYRMALPVSGLLPTPPNHVPDFAEQEDAHPDVARLLWHERFAAALDALGICRRWGLLAYGITPIELAQLASFTTGMPWTAASLAKLGERIVTLERQSIVANAPVDRLARRWQATPLGEGRAAGQLVELEQLLPLYYAAHGWDTQGRPTEARMNALDLIR